MLGDIRHTYKFDTMADFSFAGNSSAAPRRPTVHELLGPGFFNEETEIRLAPRMFSRDNKAQDYGFKDNVIPEQ